MNYVDLTRDTFRAAHTGFTAPCTYAGVTILAFARGLGADDTWAAVLQQDIVGVIDVAEFLEKLPDRPEPQRLDKMVVGGRTFTVMEWKGAPVIDPVFYKVLLRGGSQ